MSLPISEMYPDKSKYKIPIGVALKACQHFSDGYDEDREDIAQTAMVAWLEVNHKKDAYQFIRIKGAIKDYHREQDTATKRIRNKQRKIEKLSLKMEQQLLRQPTEAELALEAGVSQKEFIKVTSPVNTHANISFEDIDGDPEDGYNPHPLYGEVHDGSISPQDVADTKSSYSLLWKHIENLTKVQQTVLRMRYEYGCSWVEIGDALDMTSSGANHSAIQAIKRLKTLLSKEDFIYA